jgi:hypothetical protein
VRARHKYVQREDIRVHVDVVCCARATYEAHSLTQVRIAEHTHSCLIRILDDNYDTAVFSTCVRCAPPRVGRHAV